MRTARLNAVCAAGMMGLIVGGCASSGDRRGPVQVLSASDFATGEAVRGGGPAIDAPGPARPTPTVTAAEARQGVGEVKVLTGPPPAAGAAPAAGSAVPERLAVDQMVGQVNGKPIYAHDFFESSDTRLRQTAAQIKNREGVRSWMNDATKVVDGQLRDQVRDELLLAEFNASLTPEQRQGALAFIESVRSEIISGNLGSAELARERLAKDEELSLEQKVKQETDREFVRTQLSRRIASRVNVSFRDIERYYQRNPEKFRPAPRAEFRVIRLAAAAERDAVTAALDAGEGFESVARRFSSWRPDDANRRVVDLARDPQSGAPLLGKADVFAAGPLNDAARGLTQGGVAGPIETGGALWWLRLDDIVDPPGKALYEVQREIEGLVREERWGEEEQRYFDQLLSNSTVTDIKTMRDRLRAYAAERYLLQPMLPEARQPATTPAPVPTSPERAQPRP
ncbi:MAG: peptidyl-prolyl cis-trans isomerase [Phycisphaerales bacterium]|nr:peptidyl-prolyl cis-trans isomerase [Phycisphaerales bacterium]